MIAITTLKEIPANCSDCILNYDCCFCLGTDHSLINNTPEGFNMFENRLPDCPLKEVKDENY